MTTIGPITLDVPVNYTRRGYDIEAFGTVSTRAQLIQLKELFAKAGAGSVVHDDIAGERPLGEDLTEAHQNIQYCAWTSGSATIRKPEDGFYLLREGPPQTYQDDSPIGFAFNYMTTLFWMGTVAYYQDGARIKDMENVADEIVMNDWGI